MDHVHMHSRIGVSASAWCPPCLAVPG